MTNPMDNSRNDTSSNRSGKLGEQPVIPGEKYRALNDESELDPFEIEFLPEFEPGRGPREPFVNEHGVVIGDHDYESPQSPLEQWTKETDPFVMAGDQWVHPYKDIGFRTRENRDLFERGITPFAGTFMHPTRLASADDEPEPHENTGPCANSDTNPDSPDVYTAELEDDSFPVPEVLDEP